MSRGNLLVLTLALALAVSPALAVETKPAPTTGKGIPAEPPVRLTLDSFNRLMKAEKALGETNRDRNLEQAFALHGDTDTIRRWGAQVEADKRYEAPLKSAGLSGSEYTRTFVA